MTRGVRIYVEGGGDSAGKRRLRQAFNAFFSRLRDLARRHRIRWTVVPCGPRGEAFDSFRRALLQNKGTFNVLLVDSEGPVSALPWEHLAAQDGWARPGGAKDEQCHLMVQAMEAWLVADPDALAEFYGKNLGKRALTLRENVEDVAKDEVLASLKRATQNTTKGRYHKIRHGAKLLAMIDQTKVRARAPHCERLFKSLTEALQTTG